MQKPENVIIGIYKITSPSGKVYIGQSVNIEKRKDSYSKLQCERQPKIYKSLNKHGWDNHLFDIIEECLIEQLDERETFWKIYYLEQVDNNWFQVLFCGLYDTGGGPKSEETKLKMRKKKYSEEVRKKISLSRTGQPISEEAKIKMSLAKKGKPNLNKGLFKSEEFKKHMRKPCVIKGVEYISRWEAAETLGVTVDGINHWIRNPKQKYDDCYWLHK